MVMSAAPASGVSVVAGDGGGVGSASAGVGHCGDDVGRAAGCGDADDDVLARGTAAGDVALAELFGVLVDLDGGGQGLGSAGHDVLHLTGGRGVGGWTLGGVERGNAAAGTSADIDQTAAVAQAARDCVDDIGDFRDGFLDRCCDLGIFVVDDAGNFECGFRVEALRGLVLAFRRQFLKQCGLVVVGIFYPGAGRFLHRGAG